MTTRVLALQRLPELQSLSYLGDVDAETCTVCSYTCCCTAKEPAKPATSF